jgi:hypothetical protein
VGESHPHALTDPYMSLSAHTAPIERPRFLALPLWTQRALAGGSLPGDGGAPHHRGGFRSSGLKESGLTHIKPLVCEGSFILGFLSMIIGGKLAFLMLTLPRGGCQGGNLSINPILYGGAINTGGDGTPARGFRFRDSVGGAPGGLCRGRRTYPSGPLMLRVILRSEGDNRENFTPTTGVGTTAAEKRQRKRRSRPTKSTYG